MRFALLAFVVLLPVQALLHPAPAYVRWLDEIVLVALLPFAVVERWRGAGFAGERAVLASLAAFGCAAAASAVANGVPALVAALGTFDYVKLVLFFWLFATLTGERTFFRRLYRVVLVIGLLACGVGLGQELVALGGGEGSWRLGIFRATSFLAHPNHLGLYALGLLLVEGARAERPRGVHALLYAGVVLSVSRFVHAAAALLTLPLLRRRPWMAMACVGSLVFSALLLPLTAHEIGGDEASYRAYALDRAVEVFEESPTLGAGPGRFGGVVSLTFRSPVYDRHPWEPRRFAFLSRIRSLDQFPAQLLAELGVLGAIAFALLYVALVRAVWLARGGERTGTGILLTVLVYPFYSLGAGLNLLVFPITFMALAGAWTGRPRSPARDAPMEGDEGDGPHADGAAEPTGEP